METIIVQPKSPKQQATIETILKALDVSFKKEEKRSFNQAFAAKIKEKEQHVKKRKATTGGAETMRPGIL